MKRSKITNRGERKAVNAKKSEVKAYKRKNRIKGESRKPKHKGLDF